jgi:nitrogen fixation NifU-like protein
MIIGRSDRLIADRLLEGVQVEGFPGYSDVVLDHYRSPRNVGDVPDTAAVAQVGDPATGDVLRISMRIEDGTIAEARFKAFGCTAAIAAGSMATTLLVGRSIEEARCLSNQDVVRALGGLPESKMHCSVLAEQAILEALGRHSEALESEAVRCRS